MYQICEKIRVKAAEIKGKRRFKATKNLEAIEASRLFPWCAVQDSNL